jgi:hypothetical protein
VERHGPERRSQHDVKNDPFRVHHELPPLVKAAKPIWVFETTHHADRCPFNESRHYICTLDDWDRLMTESGDTGQPFNGV